MSTDPNPTPLCRSDFHHDTGATRDWGARLVLCGLPAHGQDVDHDEMIDGEPGIVTWPWAPPAPPCTWELPPEPPDEVTAVRDSDGRRWLRGEDHWTDGHWTPSWQHLVAEFGPLVDATEEETNA